MDRKDELEVLAKIFEPKDESREEKRRLIPIFLLSIIVWLAFAITASSMKIEKKEDEVEIIQKLPERFAKIVVPKLVEERKKPKVAKKKVAKKTVQKTAGKGKKTEGGGAKGKGGPKTREEIRKKVRTVGVLAVLTSKRAGGALQEILAGGVVKDLDEILGAIGGVAKAEGGIALKPLGGLGGRRGGLGKGTADVGALAARGGKEVELGGKKVAKVRSKIMTETPDIVGEIDEEVVRMVAMKNQAALKYCFEKAQLRNPDISGKIVIQLTINELGRVIDIEVIESTIDDREMVSCVVRMVRRWRFPKTGGEVTITYPLVFISTK